LRQQRRGKGSGRYVATKDGLVDSKYLPIENEKEAMRGQIVSLDNDIARTSVIAEVMFENGATENVVAAEGIYIGQEIQQGKKSELSLGNVMPLSEINEGCPIFNIERVPGDGGSMVRTSGIYALILTKDAKQVFVKLPSGKTIALDPRCRATIGCVAAGGRTEKPFVKAGKKWHAMHARKRRYPGLRGVAMNAVDHPFGGSQHHPGKSKSVRRTAPPGRKVGAIASKRTGRLKKT
jgi:large subunit ribosomal protein L2